ncbi:MAG: hypothetical protein IKO51_07685 [Clostridia bacterium]|nr:hypothetical protein [Clostridia bacterium]
MKKRILSAFAAALALVLALTCLPFSVLAKTAAPSWTVPAGYNEHDYDAMAAFLETVDSRGVKNGRKLNLDYSVDDPSTWRNINWAEIGGEKRLVSALIENRSLVGTLDLSDCSGLYWLACYYNDLDALSVANCTEMIELFCFEDHLKSLDIANCTALRYLSCANNELTELDVTCCPDLYLLNCCGNKFTELDLSGNLLLALDTLRAEGEGTVEYRYRRDIESYEIIEEGCVIATAEDGAEFLGWFNADGELVCEDAEFDISYTEETELTARFGSAEALYGDLNCDGEITVEDAVLALRAAMGLVELSGSALVCGQITVEDAVTIMRIAMGL